MSTEGVHLSTTLTIIFGHLPLLQVDVLLVRQRRRVKVLHVLPKVLFRLPRCSEARGVSEAHTSQQIGRSEAKQSTSEGQLAGEGHDEGSLGMCWGLRRTLFEPYASP